MLSVQIKRFEQILFDVSVRLRLRYFARNYSLFDDKIKRKSELSLKSLQERRYDKIRTLTLSLCFLFKYAV